MIENENLLVWTAYAVAALGCLLVWCRLTGWMWRYVREPLRVIVAVLLFSPTIVDPGKELFAPAIAVIALDMLFKVGTNAWHAVADLAIYGIVAFSAYLIFCFLRWPVERWWKARRAANSAPAEVEDERTLREIMAREQAPAADTRDDRNGDRRLRIEPRL
ncbi:MFS transporter [Pseudomonas sp. UL073]|uniref:MFS transporter n=1 Tax=Zestomonas insulae TaxID=2809017 RepID=A0ABS2ICB8_9GAMM|nr:MFS transporter [Pseudomonas insulae]MBM7059495.1 MFS transporter [Pseudomonas insulae]